MSKRVAKITHLADLPEVDESVPKTSEYYKRNVVPVDQGWAWVICFAGFLVYFVFGVSNQTLVVLFVELINMYDTTITMGSLVFMFSVFSVGFMSIISTNFLAPRFGERAVVCVAGFVNMGGSLGLSFSPNIGAFIVMSVIKGLATGAVFVPSISLIRLYFENRRSIAQIIANVGQSAAVIVVPPVIRIIRKQYGISGTFIVVAGFELHMTIAGLLLRPMSAYRFRPRTVKRESISKAIGEVLISEDYNEFKLHPKYKKLVGLPSQSDVEFKNSWRQDKDVKTDENVAEITPTQSLLGEPEIMSNASTSSVRMTTRSPIESITQGKDSIPSIDKITLRVSNKRNSGLSKKGSISNEHKVKRHRPSKKSVVVVPRKTKYFMGIRKMSLFLDSVEEEDERRWLFRMVLLATIPGSANLYIRNYIPAVAEGQGATMDESAILLTIVGAVDLISRLCVGLFADTHIITSVQIIIITQFCLAAVCHSLRVFTGFKSLVIFAVLIGCFIGTRISVLPLLAIEIVGVDDMPQALSFLSTIGAVSSAFMNPIFGSVAQKYGDYVLVMNLVGACFTFSSMILICMPPVLLLRRFYKGRQAKKLLHSMTEMQDAERRHAEISEIGKDGTNFDLTHKTEPVTRTLSVGV